jgi:TPR repeat protein
MVSNSNKVLKRRFSMSPYLLPFLVAAVSFVSCCISCELVAQSPEPNTFRMERRAKVLFDQKRFSEARPLFEHACASGRWDSCDALTIMYIGGLGGLPRDSSRTGKPFSEAVPVFERRCANGQADACGHLGWMYKNGIGVPENWSLFFSYSSKACDGGDGFACLNVGIEYEVGGPLKQDYSRAAVVYSRSCNAWDAIGCKCLGSLYHRGLGVARDDSRAEELFSKACNLGAAGGCTELKNMNNGR